MENNITMDFTDGQDAQIETEVKVAQKQKAKFYAFIIDQHSSYECVIQATTWKELQSSLDGLKQKGIEYNIAALVKGHEVKFFESKVITQVK